MSMLPMGNQGNKGFFSSFAPQNGALSPASYGLMQLGAGLLGATPGREGLAKGVSMAAQSMSPQAMMQRKIMEAQMGELEAKAKQRQAWQDYISRPQGAGGAQPALGGYLRDMPGGGTMPSQGAPGAGGALTDPAASATSSLLSGYPRELLAALTPEQGMSLLMQQAQPQKPTTLMQNLRAAGYQPGTPEYQARAAAAIPGAAGAGREKAQDAEGYWRFVDSGERVFPDVQKPAEQPDPSAVGGMRKEFSGQSKDYRAVRTAYSKVRETAKDPSPAGDLALIFNYMKMLDPGSVVREGEFATAQNTAGVPTQVRNMYNRAITGERLAPSQRQDFLSQAENVYAAQKSGQDLLESQYRDLAERSKYDPESVVIDYQGDLRNLGQPAQASQIQEGATATNPETGDRVIFRNGKWEPM